MRRALAASTAATPNVALGRDDILQIVFTSGTTAEPKGVVITHGNVLANIAPLEREMRGYLKYERFVHPIRFLNLLPLSHVFGQFLGMFLPPLLGGTVIFQEELKPSEVLNTIRRERVSVLVSVPRVLQSLKQKIERDLEDRGESEAFRQRFRSSAGTALPATVVDVSRDSSPVWLEVLGIYFGRRGARQRNRRILGKAGLRGDSRIWADGDDIADQREPSLPPGQRIDRKSVAGARGEAGRRRRNSGARWRRGFRILGRRSGARARFPMLQGWYRTGDIGALDEAGNLYFKGRKKEVIVTPGGTNIYPEDLEAALRRQPEVKDCVVVGIERGGNAEPCAVVILRGDAPLEEVVRRANRIAGGVSTNAHVDRMAAGRFSPHQHAEAAAKRDTRSGAGATAGAGSRRWLESPSGGVDCAGDRTVCWLACARMRLSTPIWG